MTAPTKEMIAGLIVAGGTGSRMGGTDKCLLTLDGISLLAHCVSRLEPQVNVIGLNANGDLGRFTNTLATLPLMPILPDMPPSAGPLSGVVAGLTWLQHQPEQWLLTVAADTPFFPQNLAQRLSVGLGVKSTLAVACDKHSMHPLFGLWHQSLLPTLQQAINNGEFKMQQLVKRLGGIQVAFDTDAADPFFNINTPSDLTQAAELAAAATSANALKAK